MPKDSISKTAQVNLQMLASLGIPEAVQFSHALNLEGDPLGALSHLPFARRIPLCVSCISEVLYQSANSLGQRATSLVKGIYGILDRRVGRDRKEMGWQSADEMASALQELGFTVRRVTLLHEGMELRCMDRMGRDAAARLRECWSDKSSLVVQPATPA